MPTAIEWTQETWNPVTGCTKVSAGCDHCYAERITNRFGGKGAFDTVVLHPERLDKPFSWRKPRTVFVNSMSDLFHADVSRSFIADAFAVMALTSRHTFQILTKRPGRMRSLLSDERFIAEVQETATERFCRFAGYDNWRYDLDSWTTRPDGKGSNIWCPPWPLRNVWLGVSCEDQETADKRVPVLLDTRAAVRFLSCEPLLGPIDLGIADHRNHERDYDGGDRYVCLVCSTEDEQVEWFTYDGHPAVDWVIVGGESGPQARPMQPDWARSLRDQCVEAGVPFFFKQVGGRTPKAGGRELDGRTWDEMPERAQ